jgi:hypothetical protein
MLLALLRLIRFREADAGTRTPDPFITSEVLYQLSYVGIFGLLSAAMVSPARRLSPFGKLDAIWI